MISKRWETMRWALWPLWSRLDRVPGRACCGQGRQGRALVAALTRGEEARSQGAGGPELPGRVARAEARGVSEGPQLSADQHTCRRKLPQLCKPLPKGPGACTGPGGHVLPKPKTELLLIQGHQFLSWSDFWRWSIYLLSWLWWLFQGCVSVSSFIKLHSDMDSVILQWGSSIKTSRECVLLFVILKTQQYKEFHRHNMSKFPCMWSY